MQYKYSEKQKSNFATKYSPLNMEERNRYCILSAIGGVYSYLVIPITIGSALLENLRLKNLFLAVSMFGVVGVLGWWFQKTSETGQSGRMKLFKHHLIDLRTLQPVTGFRFHQYRVLNCLTSCAALLIHSFNVVLRGAPGPLSSNVQLNDYKGQLVKAMEGPQKLADTGAASEPASKGVKPRPPTKLEMEIHKSSQFLSRFDEKMGLIVVVERQAERDDGKVKIDDSEQLQSVPEDAVSKDVRKYFT